MDTSSKSSLVFSWGVVLSMFGISAMALIKIGLHEDLSVLSILIQVLSCLLLFNYHKIRSYALPSLGFIFILAYSFYILFLAAVSGIPFMQSPDGFIYQLFYAFQIVFLWNNIDRVNFEQLNNILLWVAGSLTFIAFLFILNDIKYTGSFFFSGLGLNEFNQIIVSRDTTSGLAFNTLLLILVSRKWPYSKVWLYIFGYMAIFVMLCSNRRSNTGAILVILVYHIMRGRMKINRKYFSWFILNMGIIIISGLLLYLCFPAIQEIVQNYIESFWQAIGTYFGNSSSFDISASYRRQYLETIPHLYLFDSSFKEFIFGRGYMETWLDIPYLQAFWDLGFVGGIYFIGIWLVLPLYYIIKHTNEPVIQFVQYIVLTRIILNCCSGLPYGTFFPLVLLMLLFKVYVKRNDDKLLKVS